ncbi:Uncharacterised protein [Bacteroides eggerthii]|uniref:Uncharacterized protein n=1 Tax=Bacteroides eggerthii TaxID=28111 RepID=A0A380YMY0_9BACE|nr:hypothetical protein BACEGG_01948 [Bacteroides eggerthii DSM 20697]SUV29867.1 Uncharacterised protein [Bacteroides eggerthii]
MNPVVDSLSYSAIQPPEIIRRLVTLTNKLYIDIRKNNDVNIRRNSII